MHNAPLHMGLSTESFHGLCVRQSDTHGDLNVLGAIYQIILWAGTVYLSILAYTNDEG